MKSVVLDKAQRVFGVLQPVNVNAGTREYFCWVLAKFPQNLG